MPQLPEIKYSLSKLSKILSHGSTGSAVGRTYPLKLPSSLAKSSLFSLQGVPNAATPHSHLSGKLSHKNVGLLSQNRDWITDAPTTPGGNILWNVVLHPTTSSQPWTHQNHKQHHIVILTKSNKIQSSEIPKSWLQTTSWQMVFTQGFTTLL